MNMLLQGDAAHSASKTASADTKIILSYVVFFVGAVTLYHALSAGFSSTLTLGAGFQCLGFILLGMQVQKQRIAAGVSGKMLMMYAGTLCFRLSSTVWLNGYLPIDETGDWAYQALELSSLALIAYCLRSVFVVHRGTYQQKHDSLPVSLGSIVMTCVFVAVAIHPNLDRIPTFDIFWTTSCYLEAFAMLPQLYMFLHKGVEMEPLTGHFVVLSTLSRACSLAFWYRGFSDLGGAMGGFNMQGWMVMGSHIVQLLFSVNALVLCSYLRTYCELVPASSSTTVIEDKLQMPKQSDVENQTDDPPPMSIDLY